MYHSGSPHIHHHCTAAQHPDWLLCVLLTTMFVVQAKGSKDEVEQRLKMRDGEQAELLEEAFKANSDLINRVAQLDQQLKDAQEVCHYESYVFYVPLPPVPPSPSSCSSSAFLLPELHSSSSYLVLFSLFLFHPFPPLLVTLPLFLYFPFFLQPSPSSFSTFSSQPPSSPSPQP